MIYLRNTTDAQIVRIPASGPKLDGPFTMRIVNTIDRGDGYDITLTPAMIYVRLVGADGALIHDSEERQILVASAGTDKSRLYYFVGLRLPAGLPEGEYEYEAKAGDSVISSGLAIIGEPKAAVTSYDKPVQYEQYNAN